MYMGINKSGHYHPSVSIDATMFTVGYWVLANLCDATAFDNEINRFAIGHRFGVE
jgi:hypothetical protein